MATVDFQAAMEDAVRVGDAMPHEIPAELMTLAALSLASPDESALAGAFLDLFQETFPESRTGAVLGKFVASDDIRHAGGTRRDDDYLIADDALETAYFPSSGRPRPFASEDRIEIVKRAAVAFDLSPTYYREDAAGQWWSATRVNPVTRRRGQRRFRKTKLTARQVAEAMAAYGADNLCHAVIGCHYFAPTGAGRKP